MSSSSLLTPSSWYPYVLFSEKEDREEKLKQKSRNQSETVSSSSCAQRCRERKATQRSPSSGCFIMIIYFFVMLYDAALLLVLLKNQNFSRDIFSREQKGRKGENRFRYCCDHLCPTSCRVIEISCETKNSLREAAFNEIFSPKEGISLRKLYYLFFLLFRARN